MSAIYISVFSINKNIKWHKWRHHSIQYYPQAKRLKIEIRNERNIMAWLSNIVQTNLIKRNNRT